MDSSLYVGLSRQMVLQRSMEMVSNNVANVSTPGYRTQNPMFDEYLSKPKGASDALSMVYDKGQYTTTTPGTSQFTGGTYDVALTGPGFMGVQTLTGGMQYTRAGNFTVDKTGMLVTSSGLQVAGSGGAPILIPQGSTNIKILDDGQVMADGSSVGQIGMYEFSNLQNLKPEGNGLYSSTSPGNPATTTTMKQGMVEGSNVNAITEMSRMIEISRDYEQTMNLLKSEHDRESGAIQALAKTNG